MTIREAMEIAAKEGFLALYQRGWDDRAKNLEPMMREIHDKVYEQGVKKGREGAIEEAITICNDCNKCQFACFNNGYYQGCALQQLKEHKE